MTLVKRKEVEGKRRKFHNGGEGGFQIFVPLNRYQ
jgi:hypothetical protein